MRVLICQYGIAHIKGRCTCGKISKFTKLVYVPSEELKQLSPGIYKVYARPIPGQNKIELVPPQY